MRLKVRVQFAFSPTGESLPSPDSPASAVWDRLTSHTQSVWYLVYLQVVTPYRSPFIQRSLSSPTPWTYVGQHIAGDLKTLRDGEPLKGRTR